MKKKKWTVKQEEMYWDGPEYNCRLEVKVSEQMYLFLKETAKRCDTSVSSLVRQSIRAMKREFEWDCKYGRGKETK